MMQLILRENNFEIYGNSIDLFSVRNVKTDVFHHFRKYEEAINFMRSGKIQMKPKTYEICVKYFQGQNYTPKDAMRRWAMENYTPLFYGIYGEPYLYFYKANYYYDSWKIQKK